MSTAFNDDDYNAEQFDAWWHSAEADRMRSLTGTAKTPMTRLAHYVAFLQGAMHGTSQLAATFETRATLAGLKG